MNSTLAAEPKSTPSRARDAGDPPPVEPMEFLLRRVVPAMIVLFLLTLFGVAAQIAAQSYSRVVPDALEELDMVGRLAVEDLNAAMRNAAPGAPAAMLIDAAQGRLLAHGRSLLVTNPEGEIVAALPPSPLAAGQLSALLGGGLPLALFADKAGPMRVTLPDGSEALVSVRNLEAPFGQLAILQPLHSALAEWRAAAWRSGVLLLLTMAVMGVVAFAYFSQAARTLDAETDRARIRAPHRRRAQSRPLRPVGTGTSPPAASPGRTRCTPCSA